MYDFTHCKLCSQPSATPVYLLKQSTIYCCQSCDFHYIDYLDDLSEPESTAPLDDRTSRLIEAKLPDNTRLHHTRLAFVKKHASLTGAQCIDIGAGVGIYLHLIAGAGASVHGIEPGGVNRLFARQKFGLTLEPQTIDHPFWQEGYRDTFDQATLWDVIEHVNFPRETLASAFTVIKPGGWLFLDTPSRDSLYYRISEFTYRSSQGRNVNLLNSLYSSARFGHKQIFRPLQLTLLLKDIGFNLVTVKGVHDINLPLSPGLNTLINVGAALIRPKDKIIICCRKPLTAQT